MKSGSVLINSSRGPVVATNAAREVLQAGHLKTMILDVWENEPNIDIDLLDLVQLGTPHIAGYSFDGKVNGTQMIYQAACLHFNQPIVWDPQTVLPQPENPEFILNTCCKSDEEVLYEAVSGVYAITRDNENLRQLTQLPPEERGRYFDNLRKNYPRRREFFNCRVLLQGGTNLLADKLSGLGFQVVFNSPKCTGVVKPVSRISI